jgi:hypothetical protein
MPGRFSRLLALSVVAALVLASAPPALAIGPRDRAALKAARHAPRHASVSALTVPSGAYAPDPADSADDTWTAAVSIEGQLGMPVFDGSYEATARAFYKATGTAADGGDEDWWSFHVSESEIGSATYLFEAQTASTTVDPIIEVYRADGDGHIFPTAPDKLPWPATDLSLGTTGCVAANDSGVWISAGNGASCPFVADEPGDYFVRVRPAYFEGDGFLDGAGPYEFRAKAGQFSRLGGASRIDVAVNISREQFPTGYGPDFAEGQPTVVVANGYKPSDALPAAALAYAVDGPLLMLPDRGGLPYSVRTEIVRYGATRVIIVGGTATVSTAMALQLAGVAGVTTVQRVAGADRYAVARNIAVRADAEYGVSPFAFVVSSTKFADALSATPMSAYNVAPILYSNGFSIDRTSLNTLTSLAISDVCIVGGTGSVSAGVENTLKARLGATHVMRIGGVDRYEASKNFARWATELSEPLPRNGSVGTSGSPEALARLEATEMGSASGSVFADALAGGAFAGAAGAPVILTPGTGLSPYLWDKNAKLPAGKTDWITDVRNSGEEPGRILRSYVFGGAGTVTQGVLRDLDLMTR